MLKIFKLRRLCKRIKKLNRTSKVKSVTIVLTMAIVYACFFTLIIYHIYHITFAQHDPKRNEINQRILRNLQNYDTPMRHIHNNEIYKDYYTNEVDSIEMEETRQDRKKVYMKDRRVGNTDKMAWYTSCKTLRNKEKFRLENDFINVQCFDYDTHNKSYLIYEDNYIFCKRITLPDAKKNVNQDKYNVLMIGMDSMSLPRFAQTMTRTINFFKSRNWQSYRGYNKVGDNKLSNLIPALTGKHSSEIFKNCLRRTDRCNKYFLWSLFKKSGYVTAYGEDNLELDGEDNLESDTFSREFSFRKSPTDHYIKPFFLNREYYTDNRSILCCGKTTSGKQILDFAYDFALTYRNDSFFGFFWINSFSHNINSHPQDADVLFEDFFNRLFYTGVLDNTFIVFISDHGIRFGKPRLQLESYYDDRMPFLFFWIPNQFRIRYPAKLKGILINQFRLITPYDLFATLQDINNLANNKSVTNRGNIKGNYENKIERQSMFKIISDNRACKDVGIHEKFCTCHKLYPLDVADAEGIKSVKYVVSYMKTALKTIKTKRCWSCSNITIQNISRIHFYFDSNKINLYYVIAFSMSPKNTFYEAVVLRNDTRLALVGSINLISQYDGFGSCTMKRTDKIFCICQRIYNCRISNK
ncbi:uncharacterized protein LOC116767454 [Danaus plexippus]|uniref:uncharacterized protein LOC116767454 n=1 Tax=Danaus plexippus TaxID=13037 RepID=UPI002AB13753|nr:uncharacterized protein LOC116767454 [Danaus plexippus]